MTALVPTNNQVTVVPNGTRISKLDDLVSRYQSYFRQTAEGYVKLCAVVREAEEALGYNEALLNEFCTKVGLCRDGSKYRKLRTIGQAANDLLPFAHKLPDSWTTLYQLARLQPHEIRAVTADDRFGPKTTAAGLQEIRTSSQKSKIGSESISHDIYIDVTKVKDPQKLFEQLDAMKADLGIDYRCRRSRDFKKNHYLRRPYDL